MGACSGCGFAEDPEPDMDEKNFKRHVRQQLLPSTELDDNALHLCVIERDHNKLAQALNKHKQQINQLDIYGYTALHLAVLLKWEKGIDLLLSHYANPLIASSSGWTAIQEAISTKQFKIVQKLIRALNKHFAEYSKQNVASIYDTLTAKTDFYIEIKLESFAKGLSGVTGQYFPCDTLKIWKKNEMVRVDMTLVDFDYDRKEWIRGNLSDIFIVKKAGFIDVYHINHDDKTIELDSNVPLLIHDGIDFDISKSSTLNTEIQKLCSKPVKSRKIEIEKAQFKRQKSWIGAVEQQVIDGITCSVYKATDIKFVTRYRNWHIPVERRKAIKNDSSIISVMMAGGDQLDEDEKSEWTADLKEVDSEYQPPQIRVDEYQRGIEQEDNTSLLIDTVETNVSEKSYNLSICMTDGYGIDINEILVVFDLLSLQTKHVGIVKRILQLTAYDEDRFPLCLEMPLLLNVVRAKITFQALNREAIDANVFATQFANYTR